MAKDRQTHASVELVKDWAYFPRDTYFGENSLKTGLRGGAQLKLFQLTYSAFFLWELQPGVYTGLERLCLPKWTDRHDRQT